MRYYFLAVVLYLSTTAYSQNTRFFEDQDTHFRLGLDLLDKSQYGAARKEFERYLEKSENEIKAADANYYIAFCALGLYHQDGEKRIEDFIINHPDHPKSVVAYYELGNFYFSEKKYPKAANFYSKVDLALITEQQRQETRFKLGYSYFASKKLDEALPLFNILKSGRTDYSAAANYYAGYIEYHKGQFDKAIIDLEKAGKDESYAAVAPELLANLYYKQKRYDDLISYTDKMDDEALRKVKNLNLMLGDAYLFKGNTERAAEAYKAYEGVSKKLSREIRYRIGYSYFLEQDFSSSIEQLKRVASEKDSIGVYSSYYLGVMYLKEGNKLYAKTAFNSARDNSINEKLREEGAYQFAKVSYDIGEAQQAVDAFDYYLTTYPNGKHIGEVNDLISEAYLNSNDYELAIAHIDNQTTINSSLKRVYQKATFMKGSELFNKADYRGSINYFSKSLKYKVDPDFTNLSNLWIAEAYSVGRRYDDALPYYQVVIGATSPGNDQTAMQARYGLGYVYFNTKQYNKALLHFKYFVENSESNDQNYVDAKVRLADCYYVAKNYNSAITYYKQIVADDQSDVDYGLYQLGAIYGIQGDMPSAINALDKVVDIKRSRFGDDALFQKGQLYFEKGQYKSAITAFNQLISSKPKSKFVPYAHLRRGSANYNEQNYTASIEDYTVILRGYANHSTAGQVLLPLQEVLNLTNRGDEFDGFLADYKESNPNTEGLEAVEFETAKNQYFNLSYQKAISRFEQFIDTYPNDAKVDEAKYYIAESYYRLREYEPALEVYNELSALNSLPQRNRILGRIAEIEFSSSRYENAIYFYRQLNGVAASKKEQYNVWAGLMESYYRLGEYDSTITYANTILEEGNVHISSQNKASLYLAKSAFSKGDYIQAEDEFLATLNSARDQYGAEALYLLGELYYQQENWNKSIETLIDLNKNFSGYDEWVGKGYLLLADNYLKLGDVFQAKGTLRSVADNFPDEFYRSKALEKLQAIEFMTEETDTINSATDTLLIEN